MNLTHRFFRYIDNLRRTIDDFANRLVDPKKKIGDHRLKIDDLTARMIRVFNNSVIYQREKLAFRTERLNANNPLLLVKNVKVKFDQITHNLLLYMVIYLNKKKYLLREVNARLHGLNPSAVLERGYSITRTIPDATVVIDPETINIGQDLEVTVARGKLICRVKGK